MDACIAVESEVDKVLSKFGDMRQNYSDVLQQLIDDLETIKNDVTANSINDENKETTFNMIQIFIKKSKESTQNLATEHREFHSTISKVGRAIDKNFVSDFSSTCKDDIFSDPKNIVWLNQIICHHFYKLGNIDIADEFVKESGITVKSGMREQFTQINFIKESLQNKNIVPALKWAKENRLQLNAQMYPPFDLIKRISTASNLPVRIPYTKRIKFSTGKMKPRPKARKIQQFELAKKKLEKFFKSSSLEFKLHQLAFLRIVKKGVMFQTEAVEYAKTNFGQFVEKHEKEIQKMMGTLLFIPQGIENSPYSNINEESIWLEVNELFKRDACSLFDLSFDSLLNVSINAGCLALPALLNIKHVMKQRKIGNIWNEKEELPIEINLDSENRYHSTFACPILRQQSSETNPPMKLICGHVISKDALHKLGSSNKLKCPYCPMEQNSSEAKRIYF